MSVLPTIVDRAACVAAFGNWVYPTLKHQADLERYRTILSWGRVNAVLECGTHNGASAAWFAQHVGLVVTIDNTPRPHVGHQGPGTIIYLHGDCTDPATVHRAAALLAGYNVMVSLDSDHSAEHVAREIELYAPLVSPGCHLVVEDGVIGWLGMETLLAHGCEIYHGTVLEGIEAALLAGHLDGFTRDEQIERASLVRPPIPAVTMSPAGWWVHHPRQPWQPSPLEG